MATIDYTSILTALATLLTAYAARLGARKVYTIRSKLLEHGNLTERHAALLASRSEVLAELASERKNLRWYEDEARRLSGRVFELESRIHFLTADEKGSAQSPTRVRSRNRRKIQTIYVGKTK